MKELFFFLLVLPLQLFAQKADSLALNSVNVSESKLNTWYKSTYKVASYQPCIVIRSEVKSVSKHIVSYKPASDMFLYSPYLHSNRPFSTTANLTNTPYYGGYLLDPTGGSTIGQVLLAGGINYLLDKAIAGKEKKSKKK